MRIPQEFETGAQVAATFPANLQWTIPVLLCIESVLKRPRYGAGVELLSELSGDSPHQRAMVWFGFGVEYLRLDVSRTRYSIFFNGKEKVFRRFGRTERQARAGMEKSPCNKKPKIRKFITYCLSDLYRQQAEAAMQHVMGS